MHAERQRARGYNQSALLAERLAAPLGLVMAEELLQRTRYTTPQVGLNAAERLDNVRGAFTAVAAGVNGR
ncbi:ComF family protein, partial [Arthrospira platensis SPKY1]|nr:ComF family protein [Arthrospira platensis SPKY1]